MLFEYVKWWKEFSVYNDRIAASVQDEEQEEGGSYIGDGKQGHVTPDQWISAEYFGVFFSGDIINISY